MPAHLHEDHVGTGLSFNGTTLTASGGGPTRENFTSTGTLTTDGAACFVDTSQGAITVTAGAALTFFTVYDSHFNFALNNCTVDFGGGTTRVMSLDGEIMTFFKDDLDAWRYISVSVGSGGAV